MAGVKRIHDFDDENVKCPCGALQKLSKVIDVNHQWQQDYTKLQEEYNILKAKVITVERRNEELERENQNLLEKLEDHLNAPKGDGDNTTPIKEIQYTIDDVEALKQQLVIYKEDFMQEKNDHTRVSKENNKIKLELQRAQSMIEKLNQKNSLLKENFRKVSAEKEHILQELRKLSMTPTKPISNEVETRIPCLRYNNNNNPMGTLNCYTLRQQRYGSDESLKSEDVLAHAPAVKRNSYFYGGYVERDGLTLSPKNDRPHST